MYACMHRAQFQAPNMALPQRATRANALWGPHSIGLPTQADMPWPPMAWLAPEAKAVPFLSLRFRWPLAHEVPICFFQRGPQYVGPVPWEVPDPDFWR